MSFYWNKASQCFSSQTTLSSSIQVILSKCGVIWRRLTERGRRQTKYFEGPGAVLPLNCCIAAFHIQGTRKINMETTLKTFPAFLTFVAIQDKSEISKLFGTRGIQDYIAFHQIMLVFIALHWIWLILSDFTRLHWISFQSIESHGISWDSKGYYWLTKCVVLWAIYNRPTHTTVW